MLRSKLVICTIFYQDLEGIKKLVNSKHMLDIIFVDGRFIGWDGPILSDDGSREYILSKGYEIINAPDLIEHQKRNRYIERAQELGYDYCLVIDSDEYIEHFNHTMILKDLSLNLDSYSYVQKYDSTDHIPYYRLHSSKARHLDRHQNAFINGNSIFSKGSRIIHGLVTVHNKSHRSNSRQEYRLKYYELNPIR